MNEHDSRRVGSFRALLVVHRAADASAAQLGLPRAGLGSEPKRRPEEPISVDWDAGSLLSGLPASAEICTEPRSDGRKPGWDEEEPRAYHRLGPARAELALAFEPNLPPTIRPEAGPRDAAANGAPEPCDVTILLGDGTACPAGDTGSSSRRRVLAGRPKRRVRRLSACSPSGGYRRSGSCSQHSATDRSSFRV